MKAKKRVLATICVFLLTAAIAVTLAACSVPPPAKTVAKNSPKKVYAFSAVTGATMLSDTFQKKPAPAQAAPGDPATPPTTPTVGRPDEVSADIAKINGYIKMFEGYLVGNGVNEVVSKPTEADGIYKDYGVKTTMEIPKLGGKSESYTMYYKEVNSKTNTEVELKEDGTPDESETTTETTLTGVMLFGTEVYPINGSKEIEVEGTETETVITFTTRMPEGGDKNYITVTQEMEQGEMLYDYQVFQDGKLLTKTKIEIETEEETEGTATEKEEKVKLTFFDKAGTTPAHNTYWFERETEAGETFIKIKYTSNGAPASFIKVKVDAKGGYHYTYENGFEEEVD